MVRGGANQRKYLDILAEGFDLLLWNVQAGKEIGYEENMLGCQFLNIQKNIFREDQSIPYNWRRGGAKQGKYI